ncbi:hypothetical protein D3C73_501790 [compost metagenome]
MLHRQPINLPSNGTRHYRSQQDNQAQDFLIAQIIVLLSISEDGHSLQKYQRQNEAEHRVHHGHGQGIPRKGRPDKGYEQINQEG